MFVSADHRKVSTTLVTNLQNNEQCLDALREQYQLPQDSLDKYLCLHYEPSSALSSYQMQLGAPIHFFEYFNYYVVGLNLVANEVELDTPMIGIWFNTHKAWLESVLLKDNAEKTPIFGNVAIVLVITTQY